MSKQTRTYVLVAIALAFGLTVWVGLAPRDEVAGPRQPAKLVQLNALPQERIARNSEWRDARILPAGVHRIDAGRIGPSGVLRLALTPQGATQLPIGLRIEAGDRYREERLDIDPLRWHEWNLDLSKLAGPGDVCRITLESEVGVCIAACEMSDQQRSRPNVLIFLVDTLRADHLGCYGYDRNTSPHFDALARDGVRIARMVAQSSWTRPSVASLLTSQYAEVHRAKDRADMLPRDTTTLESMMRDAGYETQGFMSNPTCLPTWGFGHGFTRFVDVDSFTVNPGKDRDVVDAALAALQFTGARPWFFYVHAIGPHSPYDPPSPYDARFAAASEAGTDERTERARLRDLYDGEIAFTDAQFGRLIGELKRRGLYGDTLVMVLSDHGEELWEHGKWGHGSSLYDEQILVPCIIKLPGETHAGTVCEGIAELIDVAPTTLDYAGLALPPSFQGISLRRRIESGESDDRVAFASLYLDAYSAYAARNLAGKYINNIAEQTEAWFDLATDPAERFPLLEAPAAGSALARHAARIARSGSHGIHILITGSLLEPHTISGTLRGNDLGGAQLQYLANNGEVGPTGDGITFRVTTEQGPDCPPDLVEWHEQGAEQNNALVIVEAGLHSPIHLDVTLDGAPIDPSLVFVGHAKTNRPLTDAVLTPADIVSGTESFDPIALPRRLAVYVWYVPPTETIPDDDLDPEMAEALRALGYR